MTTTDEIAVTVGGDDCVRRTNVDRTGRDGGRGGGEREGGGTEEKVGRGRVDFYRRPRDTGSVLY